MNYFHIQAPDLLPLDIVENYSLRMDVFPLLYDPNSSFQLTIFHKQ